jgi:hypothetical protein
MGGFLSLRGRGSSAPYIDGDESVSRTTTAFSSEVDTGSHRKPLEQGLEQGKIRSRRLSRFPQSKTRMTFDRILSCAAAHRLSRSLAQSLWAPLPLCASGETARNDSWHKRAGRNQ